MIKLTAPCAKLTVTPPIYLLESVSVCYRCKKKAKVVALATSESSEDEAARITIRALRVEGLYTLTCSRSAGDGELIYANARRV